MLADKGFSETIAALEVTEFARGWLPEASERRIPNLQLAPI